MLRKIGLFIIVLVLVMGSLCYGAASKTMSPIASLTFYLGQVMCRANGSVDWLPVKKGMPFFEGDMLKSLEDGKAELFFYTGSKVRIANGTEIQFTKDEKNKAKSVFVNVGQVWNQIRKGDKFEVESVHGVASVKGTEFDVAADSNEMSVWVAEGLVQIHNDNGDVLAERNTQTIVSKDSKPDKRNIQPNALPKWKDDFSVEAILALNAPGSKQDGKPFKVNLTLKDPKSDKPFSNEMLITAKALSKGLEFAANKDASSWASTIELNVIDGKSELWVRGVEGDHEINFTGRKISGINLPLKIEGVIGSRTVELKFTGKDLKEHQLNLKYKIK